MTIEIKVPYSIEAIQDAFNQGKNTHAMLMVSNCLCYLQSTCVLCRTLVKDGRLDQSLANELINIADQAFYMQQAIKGLKSVKKEVEGR
ncbi:hypothetical protein [Snodgrassella alvi]|jgi:hypothetical protein|uniref:Uncharacterized protein n=1 Tax=Snodgrassella alvi TaxID=1196083 RepID=A0A855GAC8_9NEIS|nr:hypothetical protein [Snodgrassella alvi]PIT11650.1 hypothetical protein BGI30_04000 [Snodgrassella alvi]PIT55294.1 hypothetical protein BHC59_11070 [Snodgrassella alvi]PIT62568.1 hypothetical protein BHC57_01150 [Snodgrassella alvi]